MDSVLLAGTAATITSSTNEAVVVVVNMADAVQGAITMVSDTGAVVVLADGWTQTAQGTVHASTVQHFNSSTGHGGCARRHWQGCDTGCTVAPSGVAGPGSNPAQCPLAQVLHSVSYSLVR